MAGNSHVIVQAIEDLEAVSSALLVSNTSVIAALAAPTTFAGGVLTIATTGTPQQLTTTSVCVSVFLGSADTANAANILVGDSAGQNLIIEPYDIKAFNIPISDPSTIWVKGTAGDTLNYRILA